MPIDWLAHHHSRIQMRCREVSPMMLIIALMRDLLRSAFACLLTLTAQGSLTNDLFHHRKLS
jgi:hypothetical protein